MDSLAPTLLRMVLRSAFLLGLLTAATKGLSFLEKLFQARSLGTSASLDAYIVATSVPMAMYVFTREVVEPSVLPVYLDLRARRGTTEAGAFVTGAGLLILVSWGLATAFLLANLTATIDRLAPGLDASDRALAVRLSRATFPAGLALSLSALTGIVLNAHRRFVLPASADVARNAVLVVGFGLGVSRLGLEKMSMFFATACVARLLVHIPAFLRLSHPTKPLGFQDPDSRQALRLAAPLLLAMVFSQTAHLADNYFASRMGSGVISSLSFGRKLVDLPLLMVSYSISVVVFPYFAEFHLRRSQSESMVLLSGLLRLTTLAFAWITALCVPLARDLVNVALKRGAFGDESLAVTAQLLTLYSIGLVPLAVESILVQHYFARRDVLRPVVLGIVSVALHVGLLATLWQHVGPPALVLSYLIGKVFKVGILLCLLPPGKRSLDVKFFACLLVAMMFAAVVVALLRDTHVIGAWPPIARLVSLGILGTCVFALVVVAGRGLGAGASSRRPGDL